MILPQIPFTFVKQWGDFASPIGSLFCTIVLNFCFKLSANHVASGNLERTFAAMASLPIPAQKLERHLQCPKNAHSCICEICQ